MQWYILMRKFMKCPDLIKKIGDRLRSDMMGRYDILKVNETRAELYRELIDKNRKK